MSKPTPVTNVFHNHLDVCRQCREHPFALCFEGAALLRIEARISEKLLSEIERRAVVVSDLP